MAQDIMRFGPGTVQIRRQHWLASASSDDKIALIDEQWPEEPWVDIETAHVVRVRTATDEMSSLRVAQDVRVWVTEDVLVHVGWSERDPYVLIAQEGCVVKVCPQQVDVPLLQIASSLGAGRGTLAPTAITPEGKTIAAMDLGEIVAYRGHARVVDRGVASTVCGRQLGAVAMAYAYDATWGHVPVGRNDLWVYAWRAGQEGALLVEGASFQATPWGEITYAANDVIRMVNHLIHPVVDRWAPIVDAAIPSRVLVGFAGIVRDRLLPVLAPGVFQETDLYRTHRALREKLASGTLLA